jgi:uncharacterized protein (TIGR02466 family)
MDLFKYYLHTNTDEKLAEYLYPFSKQLLSETPLDERYPEGKTTYFYQNKPSLLKKELKTFYQFIFENAKQYLNIMEVDTKKYTVELNTVWFSEMYKNGLHEIHVHQGDDISGNFYIYTEQGSSNIRFYRPDFHYNTFTNIKFEKNNSYNSNIWEIPPEKGRLLMWQSNLLHSVERNLTNSRIAISFNLKIVKI